MTEASRRDGRADMPEQVWKENTCGTRCGVTRSDRSA